MKSASVLLAAGLLMSPPASADRCAHLPWRALQGHVAPGRSCGRVMLTTDIDLGKARMQWEVTIPRETRVAVTVQRLDARSGPVQIEIAGGWLLLDHQRFGWYSSESQWTAEGWREMPAQLAKRSPLSPMRIEIEVKADTVRARLDGQVLGQWKLGQRADRTAFAVWTSAPRGARSRLLVTDWSAPIQ